jgi:ABC-2 type transport system permease protein
MKVFWSAYYEFIKNIRDVRFLIALIAFPISIILILGTVFDGKLTEDCQKNIPVGYVILDNSEIGKGFETLVSTSPVSRLIAAKQYKTEEAALTDVDTGKIDNYFVVAGDTTTKIQNGEPAAVSIEGKKNIELVQTILEGYIAKLNAYSAAVKISQKPVSIETSDYFDRIKPADKKLPTANDYYSVLTLLQVIGLGGMLGVFIVSRNKESNIHIRLYALPTSKWTVIYGRVIGSSVFLFISCITTVIFTKFVYDSNWNGNLIVIGAALMAFSFLNIGIGILVASFTKNMSTAIGISFLVSLVSSIAAGSVTPAVSMPIINIINPIYYTKQLILGTLYNYPNYIMLKAALVLAVMIAAVYLLSFLKLRRVNYDNV